MKYSLMVKNKDNGVEKIIPVFDQEMYKMKEKVYFKDIDIFTCDFVNKDALTQYLIEKGLIDFENASYYITSRYDGRDLHFRVIFNSEEIKRVAKKSKAGYIDTSDKSYSETLDYIFSEMSNENFKESIKNGKTIQPTLRSDMYKYTELPSYKRVEDEQLERELKFKIREGIKRYKTYRGLYIFLEEYKKYGYVKAKENYQDNQNIYEQMYIEEELRKQEQQQTTQKTEETPKYKKDPSAEEPLKQIHQSAEEYNQINDEFLSEEEYKEAYGGDEASGYVYVKRG